MKKIIRITESDLARIVKRVINENTISKTLTIDCTSKLIGGLALTDQQFKTWCVKPQGAGTSTTNLGGGGSQFSGAKY